MHGYNPRLAGLGDRTGELGILCAGGKALPIRVFQLKPSGYEFDMRETEVISGGDQSLPGNPNSNGRLADNSPKLGSLRQEWFGAARTLYREKLELRLADARAELHNAQNNLSKEIAPIREWVDSLLINQDRIRRLHKLQGEDNQTILQILDSELSDRQVSSTLRAAYVTSARRSVSNWSHAASQEFTQCTEALHQALTGLATFCREHSDLPSIGIEALKSFDSARANFEAALSTLIESSNQDQDAFVLFSSELQKFNTAVAQFEKSLTRLPREHLQKIVVESNREAEDATHQRMVVTRQDRNSWLGSTTGELFKLLASLERIYSAPADSIGGENRERCEARLLEQAVQLIYKHSPRDLFVIFESLQNESHLLSRFEVMRDSNEQEIQATEQITSIVNTHARALRQLLESAEEIFEREATTLAQLTGAELDTAMQLLRGQCPGFVAQQRKLLEIANLSSSDIESVCRTEPKAISLPEAKLVDRFKTLLRDPIELREAKFSQAETQITRLLKEHGGLRSSAPDAARVLLYGFAEQGDLVPTNRTLLFTDVRRNMRQGVPQHAIGGDALRLTLENLIRLSLLTDKGTRRYERSSPARLACLSTLRCVPELIESLYREFPAPKKKKATAPAAGTQVAKPARTQIQKPAITPAVRAEVSQSIKSRTREFRTTWDPFLNTCTALATALRPFVDGHVAVKRELEKLEHEHNCAKSLEENGYKDHNLASSAMRQIFLKMKRSSGTVKVGGASFTKPKGPGVKRKGRLHKDEPTENDTDLRRKAAAETMRALKKRESTLSGKLKTVIEAFERYLPQLENIATQGMLSSIEIKNREALIAAMRNLIPAETPSNFRALSDCYDTLLKEFDSNPNTNPQALVDLIAQDQALIKAVGNLLRHDGDVQRKEKKAIAQVAMSLSGLDSETKRRIGRVLLSKTFKTKLDPETLRVAVQELNLHERRQTSTFLVQRARTRRLSSKRRNILKRKSLKLRRRLRRLR